MLLFIVVSNTFFQIFQPTRLCALVFSKVIYFPSGCTSAIETGPVDVFWYVVLADTSPLIIFMEEWESRNNSTHCLLIHSSLRLT